MWLPWQPALVMAVMVGVFGLAARRATTRRMAFAGAFCRELSLVLVLYSIWQIIGLIGTVRASDGLANGQLIYDIERNLHIMTEACIERWFLPHPLAVQFWNGYFAIAH